MSDFQDPCNLIVNYVPTPVTDEELRALFAQFGPVVSARVIVDLHTKESKGYGFVKFEDVESAQKAMDNMNGFKIYTKRLKVTVARGPNQSMASLTGSDPEIPPPPPYAQPFTPPMYFQPMTQTVPMALSMGGMPMMPVPMGGVPMMPQVPMGMQLPTFDQQSAMAFQQQPQQNYPIYPTINSSFGPNYSTTYSGRGSFPQ